MVLMTRQALCEHRGVFAYPQFIRRMGRARCREVLHRLVGWQVRNKAQLLDHSTTFTKGCEVRVRYSSSSCSRLVAVTVMVTPK